MPKRASFPTEWIILVIAVMGLLAMSIMLRRHPRGNAPSDFGILPKQISTEELRAFEAPKPPPAAIADKVKTFETFHKRPFTAAKGKGPDQWTVEDGRSQAAIAQLAHNPLEAERMTGENAKIKRRQLVYRNQTITTVIQEALSKGEQVHQSPCRANYGQRGHVEPGGPVRRRKPGDGDQRRHAHRRGRNRRKPLAGGRRHSRAGGAGWHPKRGGHAQLRCGFPAQVCAFLQ